MADIYLWTNGLLPESVSASISPCNRKRPEIERVLLHERDASLTPRHIRTSAGCGHARNRADLSPLAVLIQHEPGERLQRPGSKRSGHRQAKGPAVHDGSPYCSIISDDAQAQMPAVFACMPHKESMVSDDRPSSLSMARVSCPRPGAPGAWPGLWPSTRKPSPGVRTIRSFCVKQAVGSVPVLSCASLRNSPRRRTRAAGTPTALSWASMSAADCRANAS